MTHFLARLVERARGTAPRVEPILVPRFAPAPVVEIGSESNAVSPARWVTQETKATNGTKEAVVRQEEPAMDGPRASKERPATQKAEELEEKVDTKAQTLLVPLPRSDDREALRPDWIRGSESLRGDVLPHVQSAATEPFVRRPKHPLPGTVPSPARPSTSTDSIASPNESEANEPPIVRVTIGRIEVRAEPALAAAPPKPGPRSAPKLTLDAYLKARKEGAR